jgi:hypothetical protein
LRQKKIFGKAARQGKYSLQNGAGKRRKTKKQDKNAQKCKKHELQTEPQQVKCILDPENGTIFNSLSATGREAAETDRRNGEEKPRETEKGKNSLCN